MPFYKMKRNWSYSLAQGKYFSCPREFFLLGKGIFFDAHLQEFWTSSPQVLNLFSAPFELVLRLLWTSSKFPEMRISRLGGIEGVGFLVLLESLDLLDWLDLLEWLEGLESLEGFRRVCIY